MQAECRAFIVDEPELHDLAEHRQRQAPREERLGDQLGDEIRDDDRDCRAPEQPALSGAYHLPLSPCT